MDFTGIYCKFLFGFPRITFSYESYSFPVEYSLYVKEEFWLILQIPQPLLSKSLFWMICSSCWKYSIRWQIPLPVLRPLLQLLPLHSHRRQSTRSSGFLSTYCWSGNGVCYHICPCISASPDPGAENPGVRNICWRQGVCGNTTSLEARLRSVLKADCRHNTEVVCALSSLSQL